MKTTTSTPQERLRWNSKENSETRKKYHREYYKRYYRLHKDWLLGKSRDRTNKTREEYRERHKLERWERWANTKIRACLICSDWFALTDYRNTICPQPSCRAEHARRRYKTSYELRSGSPGAKLAERGLRLRGEYGLSVSDYDSMNRSQGGKCLICGKHDEKLCVDHSHKTGMVRGLLCRKCNTGMGQFMDSPALLRKAANYLETVVATLITIRAGANLSKRLSRQRK